MLPSWLARTDPADVARVESRTFVVTPKRQDAIPVCAEGVNGQLGHWLSPKELPQVIQDRFPNCMNGAFYFLMNRLIMSSIPYSSNLEQQNEEPTFNFSS